MIIAVDFDNTIARTTFPEIHGEIPGAVDVLTRFQQDGHTVILWTCREGKVLNDALLWLADHGFTPDCVNCHSEKQIAEWGTDPRKSVRTFISTTATHSAQSTGTGLKSS